MSLNNARPRAYLDNSATTLPCEEAVAAANRAMTDLFFNPSAAYGAAIPVMKSLNSCRKTVLGAIGPKSGSVFFTSGGTEGDYLAIAGAMKLRGARVAVCTAVEHAAVLDCVKSYEHRLVPVDGAGDIDLSAFERLMKETPDIGVVSMMEVNNETGNIYPIDEMARIVKENSGALFHSDGVQGFLHIDGTCRENVDLYSISAHKIHGLKGCGALFVKDGVNLGKVSFGGGQEQGVRNGTENTPGIFAMEAAIKADGAGATARMAALKKTLYEGIMEICPDALVNGGAPDKTAAHILNISFPGILAEVLLRSLEGDGVFVSTGSACSARQNHPSHVLAAMGLGADRIKSAIRFSLSRYTTGDEIEIALASLKKHIPVLVKFKRR